MSLNLRCSTVALLMVDKVRGGRGKIPESKFKVALTLRRKTLALIKP